MLVVVIALYLIAYAEWEFTDKMAAVKDLEVSQYSKYSFDFTYKIDGVAVNLTGYNALAQIRDAADRLITEFTVTLGGALGTVSMSLTAAQTSRLKPEEDYRYDLVLIPTGSDPDLLLKGNLLVNKGVSRSGN